MERFFTSWKSYPYTFESADVLRKHKEIVLKPRKAVVLKELQQIVGIDYDVSQLNCVPRSKYKPEMLLEPCRKFEKGGSMPAVHWTEYKTAVRKVRNLLVRKQKAVPLRLEEVPFDASKSSGLPYLTEKGEVYDITLERARECEQGKCPPPMCMFSRGKNPRVARPVLAGPFEWQLLEGKFFYPLQDLLLSFDNPYLVGRHSCTVGAKLNELAYYPFVLCMDYSGFDGSISSDLINSSFAILHKMLTLSPREECQWQSIVSYFITSPILCPDRRVYFGKRHGVPSGSMFTQMIDSISNMIIIEYINERLQLNRGKYYVVGDDSVVAVESVDVDKVIKIASEIGITVNREKTQVVDTSKTAQIHFLGHSHESGVPTRSVEETLERLFTPERLSKEIFSRDRAVRMSYYLKRLRAYQEDNASPEVWRILHRAEMRILWPNSPETIVQLHESLDDERHRFAGAEIVEQDRWNPNRRQLRSDMAGRWARPAVYWT